VYIQVAVVLRTGAAFKANASHFKQELKTPNYPRRIKTPKAQPTRRCLSMTSQRNIEAHNKHDLLKRSKLKQGALFIAFPSTRSGPGKPKL